LAVKFTQLKWKTEKHLEQITDFFALFKVISQLEHSKYTDILSFNVNKEFTENKSVNSFWKQLIHKLTNAIDFI
jgi:hypothetical protein